MAKQSAAATAAGKKGGLRKELTGRQKAAIFLVTVGSEISSEIFKHLREDEIEALTFEIARLETVDSEERDRVLMEFQELMMAQDFITTGGIEYARELLEKSLGSQKAVDIINRLTSSLQVRPFDFVRRTDPMHLLNFIQQEHPQTIALILAYLEPQKASIILASLSHEIQSDVAKRIAQMDQTSPETLREVERVLEKKLSTLSSEDYTAAGGVESIVEIPLARTLAPAPEILLLDEPFSNLDPRTAKFLRLELKHLQKKMSLTAVYVTHNQMEAFEMGDRIAVVSQGRIAQIGEPTEILFAPKTNSVSNLFGAPNILDCQKIENLDFGLAKAVCGRLTVIVPYEGGKVDKIAIFPAGIHLSRSPINTPMPNRLKGRVHSIRHTPPVTHVNIDCEGQLITAELPEHLWSELDIHCSDPVHMAIPLKRIRIKR